MPISTAYSMVNVANTVDGQLITGLWDGDDAIVVAPMTDRGQMLVGAAGDSIFSISANRGATITLRLMHTSPTHRLLMRKEALQRDLGALAAPFPFTGTDTVSGEGGTADRCYIQTAPSQANGNNASVREWVLVTGEWNAEIPNG